MVLDILCIGAIVTLILIIVVAILIWKFLAPESPGTGTRHLYSRTGPPLPPGSHRSHVYSQGMDAGIGPEPADPVCPTCGGPGTFDAGRRAHYCGRCRKWF